MTQALTRSSPVGPYVVLSAFRRVRNKLLSRVSCSVCDVLVQQPEPVKTHCFKLPRASCSSWEKDKNQFHFAFCPLLCPAFPRVQSVPCSPWTRHTALLHSLRSQPASSSPEPLTCPPSPKLLQTQFFTFSSKPEHLFFRAGV